LALRLFGQLYISRVKYIENILPVLSSINLKILKDYLSPTGGGYDSRHERYACFIAKQLPDVADLLSVMLDAGIDFYGTSEKVIRYCGNR